MRNLTLLATLIAALALSAAPRAMADTGGPDDFGYTYADNGEGTVAYEWVDISGMSPTTLTLADDEASVAIPLGFEFSFYGTTFTNVYIHSNGFVKFDAETFSSYMGDQCPLPLADDVNGMIAFYYRDNNPADGGTISYASDTTSTPNRFIVEFDAVHLCCQSYTPPSDPDPVTLQLVLYDTGEFQVNVDDPGPAEGGDATIGIEAQDAITGLSYRGCLLSGSVVNDAAIRFYPPTSGTPVVPRTKKLWGRPGDTLGYDYTIFNLGTADVTIAITETTSAWSPVLSATTLPLAAGGSSTFSVDVTIPASAADGDSDLSTVTFTPDVGDPVTAYAVALVQDEATETHWQLLPELPMKLENATAAVVDNYIFVMGGLRADEESPDVFYFEDTVHRYDTTTNTWDTVAPMPDGRNYMASCGMEGKIYVTGGEGDVSNPQLAWDLYIYDVATDSWEIGPVMPYGRAEHESVCDPNNDKVYVMGGIYTETGDDAFITNDMVVYDVTAGTWSDGTPMNFHRYDFVAGMPDDDTIIVAGNAYDLRGPQWTEAYSISGDAWTQLDNISVIRGTAAGGLLEGGRFCIAGGFNPSAPDGREDGFECYDDPYWIPQIPLLNFPRNNMAYTTHSGQIYAIAGDTYNETDGLVLTGVFERYPHSPIPDAPPDTAEDAEDVPPDVTPDGDAAEDVPTDVRPDTTTDVRPDTTDTVGDVQEEGGKKDEGCGCQMVV